MPADTRTLLRSGLSILLTGFIAVALMFALFGGVSRQGPHTNGGWLMLMLAMGCVPMGLLLTLLAVSKMTRSQG